MNNIDWWCTEVNVPCVCALPQLKNPFYWLRTKITLEPSHLYTSLMFGLVHALRSHTRTEQPIVQTHTHFQSQIRKLRTHNICRKCEWARQRRDRETASFPGTSLFTKLSSLAGVNATAALAHARLQSFDFRHTGVKVGTRHGTRRGCQTEIETQRERERVFVWKLSQTNECISATATVDDCSLGSNTRPYTHTHRNIAAEFAAKNYVKNKLSSLI